MSHLHMSLASAVDPHPPCLQSKMEGDVPDIEASIDAVSWVSVHDADVQEVNPCPHQQILLS